MADTQKFKKFVNMLAFIGIVAIAVVLLLRLVFEQVFSGSPEFVNALGLIAECIAYVVTAIYAFYFINAKHSLVYTIMYVISLILIVVLMIV